MHVTRPQQTAFVRMLLGMAPSPGEGHPHGGALQQMLVKMGGEGGAMGVVNDAERANVVLRASQ